MLPMFPVEKTTIILPESKKSIQIRSIFVREEQIILMGHESKNETEFLDAIEQVVNQCICTENVNSENMSFIDFIYVYLKLREISKGTTFTLTLGCDENDNEEREEDNNSKLPSKIPYDFKMEDVLKIKIKETSNKIKLTETYGLCFKKMTFPIYKKVFIPNVEKPLRTIHYLLSIELLESVLKGEENIKIQTAEEKKEIIDTLTQNGLDEVEKWFSEQSSIYIELKWKCKKCKKEHTYIDYDIISFFDLA